MLETDVVIIDFYRYRLNTSNYEIDERGLTDELLGLASLNPDARWFLVCPPHMVSFGYRVCLRLVKLLNAGADGSALAEEATIADSAQKLAAWREHVERVDGFNLTLVDSRNLTSNETRAVVELLKNVESAELTAVGGGQSEALTCVVRCMSGGAALPPRLMKVGSAPAIRREHQNYMDHARWSLGNNRRPDHSDDDIWICADRGALMFTFVAAGGVGETLRDAMRARDVSAQVTELFGTVVRPWLDQRLDQSIPIGDFMKSFLQPLSLQRADEMWNPSAVPNPVPELIDLATRVVRADLPSTITHGDLHGLNVLIQDGAPWLIDFYHTGRRTGVFDFAFADVAWFLHRTAAHGPVALECTVEECRAAEQSYATGGASLRPELDTLRHAALLVWGDDAQALFQLARACAALRHLHWPFADYEKAKWIAHTAYEHVRVLRPDWWQAPVAPTIDFS